VVGVTEGWAGLNRDWRAGDRLDEMMRTEPRQPPVILAGSTDEDGLHRRLRVVVDAPGGGHPAVEGKRSGLRRRQRETMAYRSARVIVILILLIAEISLTDSAISNGYSQTRIDLTEANNGSTLDIVVGTNVDIFLKVLPEDIYKSACYWSKITMTDASALEEVQKVVLLQTGVTAAFFNALRPGLVQLNSFRHNCSDGGVILWHVKLRVIEPH